MTEQRVRKPTHPGLIFKRRVLDRRGMSITDAANHLGLSRQSMSKFCNASARCTQDIARRIAEATGSNVGVWINLQANYDAWEAEHMAAPEVTKFPEPQAA